MMGHEFIRRVTEIANARQVPVRIDRKRGKGSHLVLHYGNRKTIVKDRRKELGPGLLSAMLRQLGIDQVDVR